MGTKVETTACELEYLRNKIIKLEVLVEVLTMGTEAPKTVEQNPTPMTCFAEFWNNLPPILNNLANRIEQAAATLERMMLQDEKKERIAAPLRNY